MTLDASDPGRGPHGADGQTLKVVIPPSARFGKQVRDEVISFAGKYQIGRGDLEEFIFAIGEALANAIEHSDSSDVIEVRCQIEHDKIVATIIDSGRGFNAGHATEVPLPDDLCERGRGLPIMRRCTDIFTVHSIPGEGTAVVLGRYLRRRGNAGKKSIAS